ncbi:sensor histidine kinase [Caldimonas tepidiphila]|uniref:sensor histidine kinase n=1 Tax=Caldimonas tepidiphila TaxID=2315841 RepID=UPI001F0BF015|nr:histidine kinase [Caldimonas tepidiphila]
MPSSRPPAARADAPGSAFGHSTIFDVAAAARPPGGREPPAPVSPFDACHVGVVLRAVLLVHAVLAVALAFTAASGWGWLLDFMRGSAVALPATLLWLVLACALKRPLATVGDAWQWAAALGLGALCGAFGWWQAGLTGLMEPPAGLPAAPWLGGAGLSAALFYALRLRARSRLPADTAARLAELQSRIRPHFLFNTLNTAIALVRVDPARAEAVLEDLAELFRVALGAGGDAVTLSEEVELARRYLAIEQLRFGSRLQVSWQLDPAAGAARVPPLLLQPLVENAVRHGVEPAEQGGWLRVSTRVRHGMVWLTIVNSLPPGEAAASRAGHGIALKNVRERLGLLHDVSAQFAAGAHGSTWRVQIAVPLD